MTSDWVKMRTDLDRDPKVIQIANYMIDSQSELMSQFGLSEKRNGDVTGDVTRDVTRRASVVSVRVIKHVIRKAVVGSLVPVWGVLRHQGKRVRNDLVVENATVSLVDDICDMPGLGRAMSQVGWINESNGSIVFPRFFEENNTDPREKSRERQRRYRDRKRKESSRNGDVTRDVTRDVTGDVTHTVTGDVTSRARERERVEEEKEGESEVEKEKKRVKKRG